MATDHLLPFHLYFRRRENVIALHILASISKGGTLSFLSPLFFLLCKGGIVNHFLVVRFVPIRCFSRISSAMRILILLRFLSRVPFRIIARCTSAPRRSFNGGWTFFNGSDSDVLDVARCSDR